MRRRHAPLYNEETWALYSFETGKKPKFASLGEAKNAYESAQKKSGTHITRQLAMEAWDRIALSIVSSARTERDIMGLTRFDVRDGSVAATLRDRKQRTVYCAHALLDETFAEIVSCLRDVQPTTRALRHKHRLFRKLCAEASSAEDFQLIYVHSPEGSELHKWAESKWDELSLKQIEAASTVKEAHTAYNNLLWAKSSSSGWQGCGDREKVPLAQMARAKWERLGELALEQVTTAEDVADLRRNLPSDSKVDALALEKWYQLVELEKIFENSFCHLKPHYVRILAPRCETFQHAAALYNCECEDFPVEVARMLLERFPELIELSP